MDSLRKILVYRVDLPPPISQGQAPNQYKVCGGASKSGGEFGFQHTCVAISG